MFDDLSRHREILGWLGALSILTFLGSLVLIPIFCVRMRADYFMPHRDAEGTFPSRHCVVRWALLILKNALGLLLVLVGIAMLFLPGQGILTLIAGIMLVSFPGKRALELRLIRIPSVLRSINALRVRAGIPLLQVPSKQT